LITQTIWGNTDKIQHEIVLIAVDVIVAFKHLHSSFKRFEFWDQISSILFSYYEWTYYTLYVGALTL
jgi:hypothetical protein